MSPDALVPPFADPANTARYLAAAAEYTEALGALDGLAFALHRGLSAAANAALDAGDHARGAAGTWLLLEMMEAQFEASNALAQRRYDAMAGWEPGNAALKGWMERMRARQVLALSPASLRAKLAAISAITGDPLAVESLAPHGGNTRPATRARVFALVVDRLAADPALDTPAFYEELVRSAREEFVGELGA